jgi:signal transduction histidine kinase
MAIYLNTFQEVEFGAAAISQIRIVLLAAVTESIAGYLIANLQKRSAELEMHQESLVIAGERLRESVSDHFHDNLQTRLVTIGIRLNKIRGSLDKTSSQEMLEVIQEIETIRSAEVREFAREISPDFRLDGLQVSLERLFARYKPVISCNIHNPQSLEIGAGDSQQFSAGIYRIVEQTLSNSLMHGQASQFDVVFSRLKSDMTIEITNNGSPLDLSHYSQGHGFAVIDAWVMKFRGSWSVANVAGQVKITLSWPA